MKELKYLNKYFLKYKYSFFLGLIFTILAQIFSLFAPEYFGKSINVIKDLLKTNPSLAKSELTNYILFIIFTALIAGILTFLMRQTLIVMSRHIEFDLKNEVFQHYEKLSQNFYKKNRTGDLMNRISEDVGKVRMYVGPAVMYTSNIIIRFTVVIIYMYQISPKLTLYSVLPLPLLSYSIFKISRKINVQSGLFQKNLSTLSSFTQEFFSGIRVVKAYALEDLKINEFKTLTKDSKDKYLDLAKTQALFGPLLILLIGLSNLVVIYVGGKMYITGEIEKIGTIAQFILYINMLTWPVASLGWVSSMIQEAEASQKRLNEFLKTEPEIKNLVSKNTPISGKIEFRNVSFTYQDTKIKGLNDVSFTIEKGKTLAILGKTGSGKSTIITLISRLYDTDEGTIYIDDKPVKELNLYDLRNSISVVPQDAFLFSDSIINNIKFGKENATKEEIYEVARKAAVHENILNFANGYETVLGERGITLSGGQKQRVSIARAFLKEAPILLLDDCLSAVDTETEEEILHNLLQLSEQKTTIIVSHRVSSAKNADKIIIIDEGKIIQQGSHNQLIKIDGYYKELYHKQLLEKELH